MTPAPAEVLLELSFAHVVARALHVAADAGVADALDGDCRPIEELAADTGLDPDALGRLLRLLEERGVFHRDDLGRWSHTETSRLLQSDHPASMRGFAQMAGTPFCWESFTHLDHSARTGEPGINLLDRGGCFAYLESHPDESRVFHAAMTSKAHSDIAAALAVHDFSRYHRVCDVAGGRGHLLEAIIAAHPTVTGVSSSCPTSRGTSLLGTASTRRRATSSPIRCRSQTPTS